MKALIFAGVTLALLGTLSAQDLAPELAPLVAKHKADLAALEAQKAAALARVQQPYLAALDGAEKTATTTGHLEAVAAISKEREAMKNGLMAPAFPADLPSTLQTPRKSYLDGAAHAATDQAPRLKAVDADYLRALAVLQPRAAANPKLAKQIAAEKEQLLASVPGTTGTAGGGANPNGKNAVVNGSFDTVDAEGHPGGWRINNAAAESVKVVREGSNAILQEAITGPPKVLDANQHIAVPAHAKSVILRGRVRGKATDHNPDESNWGANITARFLGADEQTMLGGWQIINGGHDAGWKTLSKSFPVQNGAKTLEILCTALWVTGTFDFDDIEVEFR